MRRLISTTRRYILPNTQFTHSVVLKKKVFIRHFGSRTPSGDKEGGNTRPEGKGGKSSSPSVKEAATGDTITPEIPATEPDPWAILDILKEGVTLPREEKTVKGKGSSLQQLFEKWDSTPDQKIKPQLISLFERIVDKHDPNKKEGVHHLRYWDLYPLQIKKWLIYTKVSKGYYDQHGLWTTKTSYGQFVEALQNKTPEEPNRVEPESKIGKALSTQKPEDQLIEIEKLYKEEQAALPEDLRGQYRFKIRPEEIEDLSPKLKRLFSFKFASDGEITAFRKKQIIKKWGRWEGDTGNCAVQIAILSLRISFLEKKLLETGKKDRYNQHRLKRLAKRRRGLMQYFKRKDCATYYKVLKDAGIRDSVDIFGYRKY